MTNFRVLMFGLKLPPAQTMPALRTSRSAVRPFSGPAGFLSVSLRQRLPQGETRGDECESELQRTP
jgi:hypothetical protein